MRAKHRQPRRMSFALTIDQILARTKTVTRRTGWRELRAGDELLAVDRARGVPHSAQRVLARLRVLSVERARLFEMLERDAWKDDAAKEGFPELTAESFVQMFCRAFSCDETIEVARIEFEYQDR